MSGVPGKVRASCVCKQRMDIRDNVDLCVMEEFHVLGHVSLSSGVLLSEKYVCT